MEKEIYEKRVKIWQDFLVAELYSGKLRKRIVANGYEREEDE